MELLLLLLAGTALSGLGVAGGAAEADADGDDDGGGALDPRDRMQGKGADDAPLGDGPDRLLPTEDGGDGDDLITGGALAGRLFGGAGDDTMLGKAGADTLRGGAGDDHLIGSGADRLLGDTGDDRIDAAGGFAAGGAGNDTLWGLGGAVTLQGGSGDDVVILSPADDPPQSGTGALRGKSAVDLGDGNDRFTDMSAAPSPASGDDSVRGGSGDDTILAGHGSDSAEGGAGKDVIDTRDRRAEDGADSADGGTGDDRLSGDGGDILTGGDGADIFALDPRGMAAGGGNRAPAVITDFTPADRLEITIPGGGEITLDLLAAGDDTILRLGGQDLAILRGIAPSAIADSQITVRGAG